VSDGLLLVDKPSAMTSHDAVAVVRRALGEPRVGHLGTLDPFATGLLVLLAGRAARLAPWVDGELKAYDATIRFGAETETDDPTGAVTREAPLPEPARVREAIGRLTGTIAQVPPAYSAKQVGGRRAHRAARAGTPLALPPVSVTVHAFTVRAAQDDRWDVTIVCGGGTYIRALARDLGRLTDSAAHLVALRRTRSGPFHVDAAIPLDAFRSGSPPEPRPAREAVGQLPAESLDADAIDRVSRGMAIAAHVAGARAALVDEAGGLVAVAERQGDDWQPRVVLRDPVVHAGGTTRP
jgi:tRNA pseudouridine55 synthase